MRYHFIPMTIINNSIHNSSTSRSTTGSTAAVVAAVTPVIILSSSRHSTLLIKYDTIFTEMFCVVNCSYKYLLNAGLCHYECVENAVSD